MLSRIYDEPDAADGFRALVDRLWPRGISKQRAALTPWYCATCCASLNGA
jgi:uncharacterized protein YeaO (DUF488 family)